MHSPQRRSLQRFLAYVAPYRATIALATACGVVRYLIPLILPWTLKVVVDEFLVPTGGRPRTQLHLLMVGLIAVYVVYGIASYWRSYLAGLAGHRLIFDLRRDLHYHVQRMSLSFFDRQRIGEVVARMTSDIASAQNFVGAAFVNTAMDVAAISGVVVVLLVAHWKLALVALAVLPCYAWVSLRLTRRLRAQSRAVHDQLEEISGELHEQFGAISTIQSFTQEEAEARAFHKQSERFLHSVLSNVKLQSVALGATGFLTAIGPILVLWFGALEVLAGRLTIGTLMAFYAYLGLLYQPVQRLTELNLIVASSLAAMDRIFEVFDTYPEVRERPGARVLSRVRGEIVFDDVGFRYDGGPPVLEHFRHHLSAGTTVALVGPSGAGKSTLAKLLPRFYDVTGGRITIDGTHIRDVTLRSLRQNIAIVAQEATPLSDAAACYLRHGPHHRPPTVHDRARPRGAGPRSRQGHRTGAPRGVEGTAGERVPPLRGAAARIGAVELGDGSARCKQGPEKDILVENSKLFSLVHNLVPISNTGIHAAVDSTATRVEEIRGGT